MKQKFIWIILINSLLFYSYAKPKNMKQIKENDINILNQLGKDALSQKDLELAELYFRKSLSIENNYNANLQMANIKIQSWCTQDAKDFLLAAYKINATDDIINCAI